MIPLYDDNPTRGAPYVTIALIAVNVAVFLYELSLELTGSLDAFLEQYAFVPARFLAHPLDPMQIATIFIAMFLHAGFLHIGGNMLFLWIFGDNVEDRLGVLRYLGFYLLCGVAAFAAQTAADPTSTLPTLGASGAVAGVLGAYVLLYPRARVRTLVLLIIILEVVDLPALAVILLWFVLQLASSVTMLAGASSSGVAYTAHVGGFLTGVLLALPLRLFDRRGQARFVGWR